MPEMPDADYAALDQPEVLSLLFHPRKEFTPPPTADAAVDMLIPVEADVRIGARFHLTQRSGPSILFFHGNGEIVADYDELGPFYNRMGINFLPVDYRGYGRSNGKPTVTAMMRDCHAIFNYTRQWLQDNDYSGPLVIMGRSLGSASALELASRYADNIDALIIESGFAYAGPLLQLLGIHLMSIDFREKEGFGNIDKIRSFEKPTLIIHAEYDHIIPFADGQDLYDACRSSDKTLLKIPGANHNDIFARGMAEYMDAVQALAKKTRGNEIERKNET